MRSLLVHAAGTTVAIALLPLLVLLSAPVAGWAIGASAVAVNRLLQALVAWIVREQSTTVILGAAGFSMVFRALVTALCLFLVGARVGATGDQTIGLGRPDLALPAIIVFLVSYTVDAGIEALRRASQRADETRTLTPLTHGEIAS